MDLQGGHLADANTKLDGPGGSLELVKDAPMLNTATVTVDLSAIRHNLAVVRDLCPQSRVMAMVKADAYGHGLIPVARALSSADGLAVARLQEALLLRRAVAVQRILLLATLLDESAVRTCAECNIDVVVHDSRSLALVMAQAPITPLRVWLKLDSGMHRIGLSPNNFSTAARLLSDHPGIVELIHMTHFSAAADRATTQQQISCFSSCHQQNHSAPISMANSAALLTRADTHGDWVRPGIMLYGVNPCTGSQTVELRQAMTLRSYVIAIRNIGKDESVGYDGTWTSARPSRIGTIGIGYGDGYPRHARNGTPVWIRDHLVPLVGRVSMDSLTVDLTDFDDIGVGDETLLWGLKLPAATIAEHASTIPYEIFTSVRERVKRNYIVNTSLIAASDP